MNMKKIKLEYLTEDEASKTIAEQYWQTDERNKFLHKIVDIGKPFDFNSRDIMLLMKANVRACSMDYHCCECGGAYVFKNRGHFNQVFRPPWQCKACKIEEAAREAAEKALQEALEAERRAAENEKKRDWLERQDHQVLRIELLKTMPFKSVVYLLAFIRRCVSEDLQALNRYAANDSASLSPNEDFDEEIRQLLEKERLIVIDPSSDLDDLFLVGSDSLNDYEVAYYDPKYVKWKISYSPKHHESLADFITDLETLINTMAVPDEWFNDIEPLCREVAYQECVAYLNVMMKQHGFKFSPKAKTRLVITQALEDYSIAQVYNFIWGSVKTAERYFQTTSVMRPIAANSAIGNIQSRYESAKATNISVKAFDRHYKLPLSALSKVLFSTVLKAEDGWFNQPLRELWL